MTAALTAGSLAAAAPLEPLGPYTPCRPCNTRNSSATALDGRGFSFRVRPSVGYYDFGGDYVWTIGNIDVSGKGITSFKFTVPCQQKLLSQFITCTSGTKNVSASGPSFGADFGVDYTYKRWKFSLDLDYTEVSTNSDAQGHFANTGMIPTVHFALTENWDVYGGYQQRWKGPSAFNDSYYSESGELLGTAYDGIHLLRDWRLKLGGAFYLSTFSFPGDTRQVFNPSIIPPEVVNENVQNLPPFYLTNVPEVSVGGKGFQFDMRLDSPKSPHAVGFNFRDIFTDTAQGNLDAVYQYTVLRRENLRFDAHTELSGSFSEYYMQLYYQYTFGKR
jgi:hypothetical protein